MRIAVVGAGAMGSLFAARLMQSGFDVVLADVDPHRRAQIATDGLRIVQSAANIRIDVPCMSPDHLGKGQDLLVLFTKFGALGAALGQARHALAADGVVLALANGLGVAEQLSGMVQSRALVTGVTDVAADLRDGVVHGSRSGTITLGMADPSAPSHARTCAATCLRAAGFIVEERDDIAIAEWEKVAFNAAFNAVAALADASVGDLDSAPGQRLVDAVVTETAIVAAGAGVAIDTDAVRRRIADAFVNQRSHYPSMVQDRRAGRPTEIGAINGAIADRAQRLGIPAPINRTLTDLMLVTGG